MYLSFTKKKQQACKEIGTNNLKSRKKKQSKERSDSDSVSEVIQKLSDTDFQTTDYYVQEKREFHKRSGVQERNHMNNFKLKITVPEIKNQQLDLTTYQIHKKRAQ